VVAQRQKGLSKEVNLHGTHLDLETQVTSLLETQNLSRRVREGKVFKRKEKNSSSTPGAMLKTGKRCQGRGRSM